MDETREIMKARLQETFRNDTQETVARKLITSQSNVSKWLNGQMPTTDNLISISKAYKVSVDWLLGISDEKEIDGVVLEKMTYENTARIIDKLIEWGIIEIPDLEQIPRQEIEDEEVTDDEEDSSREPRFDSDYIKINDRILSFMLRRRYKIYEVGDDMVDFWKNTSLPKYHGLRLLKYNKEIENLIDSKNWTSFNDGDWVALVNSIADMTQEEILIELSTIEKGRKKDGN